MTAAIAEVTDLDLELGRFFGVAKELHSDTGELAMMPTCIVDEHWHGLIESGTLDQLAAQYVGDDVRVEHLESGGFDPLNWVARYEAKFGPLSPAWFTDKDGGLDETRYQQYVAGNAQRMSWDCTPGFVPSEVKASWDCTPGFAPRMSWDCTPGFVSRPSAQS